MKLNWNFLGGWGGGGAKQKEHLWEEYGYFLELHSVNKLLKGHCHRNSCILIKTVQPFDKEPVL